ncbi:ATP-binding protein [Propionivibrio sp.]|uniref:ATP-binding protein n=1 Tax=Propionivibrio sp. TaxID=2212460 RepID=UPI003BF1F515
MSILNPAARWVSRLSFRNKLRATSLVFSVSLLVALGVILAGLGSRVSVVQHEREALAVQIPALSLLANLHQYLAASQAVHEGAEQLGGLVQAQRERTERALKSLESAVAERPLLAGKLTANTTWLANWNEAFQRVDGSDAEGVAELHSQMRTALRNELDKLNESAGLLVDGDTSCSRLIDIMTVSLPELIDNTGQAARLGSVVLVNQRLKSSRRTELTLLRGNFNALVQLSMDKMQKIAREHPGMAANLEDASSRLNTAYLSVQEAMTTKILDTIDFDMMPAAYLELTGAAFDQSLAVTGTLLKDADLMLADRQALLEAQRNAVVVALVLILSLVIAGFVISYIYIMRGLKDLSDAVSTMASGDLSARVKITTSDEFGAVGTQFNSMVESLAQRTALLREKTNDIHNMLQHMPQGILTIVAGGAIHPEYSAHLETIFESREVAGQLAIDFIFDNGNLDADALSKVKSTTSACIGENRTNYNSNSHLLLGEVKKTMPDGRIKCLELNWSPIFDDADTVEKIMVCVRDVSELRLMEAKAELQKRENLENLVLRRTDELSQALDLAKLADRAKDEFLANITHELRTPLSAVIGFSSLARPLCTDPIQREYLDKVKSAGKTLSGIIDDLLDLSKIVDGRLEFETVPFSLNQLVVRCSSVVSYRAEEKGLKLVERIDAEIPDVLVGDSLRVEQILLNLLSNAVKFTAAGRVELRIGLHAREAHRVCLKIEVEDTGIGLREEEIEQMFKPFTQADASITRKFGGTGLGLAICKRLAELMDGDIKVSSQVGCGSTFQVKLWLALGEPGDLSAATKEDQESSSVRYKDVRILVVDDQPFNRDIVQGLLAVAGIHPNLAKNGREALDILSHGSEVYDLVLMDIQMPIMDGLAATRLIRKMDRFAKLPIIAMTAHTMAHEKAKSFDAGMNDHIGKPFDEAGFYRVLAKWIPRSKQRLPADTSDTPASATAVCSFPPLYGVDTQAGLALMQGNEERYRHWLSDFVEAAPIAMSQIRLAQAACEPEPASKAAHDLKGRMGLLGMNALHAMAAALEGAIDRAEPADVLLLVLERGVADMCAEIQSGIGFVASTAPATQTLLEKRPAGLPPASVTRLITRLEAGDSGCRLIIAECLAELKDTAWAKRLSEASIHIRNFDFVTATSLLADERQEETQGV